MTFELVSYLVLLLQFREIGGPEDWGDADRSVGGAGRVEHLDEQGVGASHMGPREGVVAGFI